MNVMESLFYIFDSHSKIFIDIWQPKKVKNELISWNNFKICIRKHIYAHFMPLFHLLKKTSQLTLNHKKVKKKFLESIFNEKHKNALKSHKNQKVLSGNSSENINFFDCITVLFSNLLLCSDDMFTNWLKTDIFQSGVPLYVSGTKIDSIKFYYSAMSEFTSSSSLR